MTPFLDSDTTPINHNETTSITNDNKSTDAYDTSYTMNGKHTTTPTLALCNHNTSASFMKKNGRLQEKGIMHRFFKYFGKQRRHGDKDSNLSAASASDDYHTKNRNITTTAPITPDTNEDPAHQMSKPVHGIITRDPLQEQRYADLLTDGISQGPLWKTLMEASDL